jgi:hypothetical protein
LSVGSSSQFQVNSSGDMVSIKNLGYSWPTALPTSGQTGFLQSTSAGALSWASAGAKYDIPYLMRFGNGGSNRTYYNGDGFGMNTFNTQGATQYWVTDPSSATYMNIANNQVSGSGTGTGGLCAPTYIASGACTYNGFTGWAYQDQGSASTYALSLDIYKYSPTVSGGKATTMTITHIGTQTVTVNAINSLFPVTIPPITTGGANTLAAGDVLIVFCNPNTGGSVSFVIMGSLNFGI